MSTTMSTAPLTSFPPSAVPHKHVLLSEILSVTSVMRKNSRWATSTHFFNARDTSLGTTLGLRIASPTAAAHSPGTGTREADLMAGFQEVKRAVREVEDISGMPLTTLLAPFFAIIRSPLSTGPITSAALSSLHNFFLCGLISPDSVNLESALAELSNTVSHCKFEASDSSGDEVVLLKIMTVIQDCMCSSMGNVLGDVEVCEMLETVLTTCCQMRLSEVLRRSAENAMQLLVRTVFSRLHTLDPEEEERKLAEDESDAQDGENKLSVSASSGPAAALTPAEPPGDSPDPGASEQEVSQDVIPQPSESTIAVQASTSKSQYGLPSIIELLRVLVNVLDPNDQSHTDSTRLIVLSILNAAIEAAGPRIMQFPSLEALVLDGGCKYLFLLARSENMHVLHSALRTITALFVTMSPHLKLQQELFLTFSIDRLATPILPTKTQHQHLTGTPRIGSPRPSTPAIGPPEPAADAEGGTATPPRPMVPPARGETRGLMLETLGQISRHPSFMVDLYTNYDCDINCENVFERLIEFLTKAVYPPNPNIPIDVQHKNTQYLCLDLLLAFVNDMATRGQGKAQPWPESNPPTDVLLQTKAEKKLILAGAAQFNRKPKAGIAFLEEHKLIYQDLSDTVDKNKSLAMFLKSCNRIDKKVLGEFLAKPENLDLLKTFMSLIDFKGKDITDAVRELLNSFRLPGESQQISRVTEIFAETYLASGPPDFKSADPIFVLTFSIIMLNTDLHSPQIRKRMTFEDYSKNLRGVNDGQDFTEEYLRRIYENIRKQEIVMSEEHTGQLGFEHAWQELLTRSRAAGEFMICNTNAFDLEMFKTVWRPVISTIAYAFISFDDDYIIQRAIAGFRQCATLAGQFNLPDVFDYVVVSLSQATSLLPDTLPAQVPNYPVVDFDGQSVTVSGLSVNFGTNFKGQLAAVVLFNIVNGNGNALREGWTQESPGVSIFEMFQNLFLHSLLPTRMLQMEDFLGGVSMIPLRGAQPPRPAARGDGGLLSALSSYLMTPYSASNEALVPDATDSDVENTLCTIDCIASCRLDELYSQIMQLDLDALIAAVRALEALAHERTVARLKLAPEDVTEDGKPFTLPYDPASVFLLETMVSIACQAPQYIEETWPIVFGHLSALLSSASQYSALLVERAVVGLLRICLILAVTPSLRDQIYVSFDLLAGLPRTVTNSVAEQIVAGVVLIVRKHGDIIQSQTEWSLVSALLRSTISHPEAGRECFELVSSLLTDGPSQAISVDSFSSLVMLLDEFATYAGQKVDLPQHRGRRGEQVSAASSPVIDRGKKAVDFMVELQKHISSVASAANLSAELAWRQLSLPLISALSRQSTNPSREIRHNAVAHLQRVLLGPHVIISETQTEDVFNRILFPLLDELLKPEVLQRDPRGMQETRLRASALLCKAFMHFEVRDSQTSDLRILWIEILDLLDRLMNADKGEQLYEAVPESLKNVLLVMHATGILVPPPADEGEEDKRTEGQQTLWNATQVRMERFLPGFLREVIPAPEPVAKPSPTPQTPVEPAT